LSPFAKPAIYQTPFSFQHPNRNSTFG
jgi:hypothetical protein